MVELIRAEMVVVTTTLKLVDVSSILFSSLVVLSRVCSMSHSDTILKLETNNTQIYIKIRIPGEKNMIFLFSLFYDNKKGIK